LVENEIIICDVSDKIQQMTSVQELRNKLEKTLP